MTDASLDLPAKHTVLRSFAGHLAAPPDAVYALLAQQLAPGDETGGHFLTDPARHLVIVQGDWWYRGEYRVLPEEAGSGGSHSADESRIEHEILNVAQFAHWAGAIAARGVVDAAPNAFRRLLDAVADALRQA
jgi:hypothetical protein